MVTLRRFFNDNINSILLAISIHLMVVIAFLSFKLGEDKELQHEEMLIAFNEEIMPLEEEKSEQSATDEAFGEGIPELDRQTLRSIASNVASKLDPEISTENYEKQVLQELGISTLKSPGGELEESAQQQADENAIARQNEVAENQVRDSYVPNVIRKDNTTVSYFLENRWHSYLYIPTYKCQGGGTVVMDIVINQAGKVVSAIISDNRSTSDICLREEAYHSAMSAQFNADPGSPAKQLGTITYIFLAQ
ncbi:MAG: hypothetical protein JXQ80_11690 [Bacteroidales bacterium]|nr:hypothetical protein [Bacteroidales bacterium]